MRKLGSVRAEEREELIVNLTFCRRASDPKMCDGPDRSDRDEDTPIRAKSIQLEC